MLVDWLYRTTLEVSLLIGLVLLVRPVARRVFGARAAYWLWFIPLVRAVLVDRPEWPRSVAEAVVARGGELAVGIYSSPDAWTPPSGAPWDEVWIAGVLSWAALRVIGAIRFRRALAAQSTLQELPAQLAAMVPKRLLRRAPKYFATDLPGTPFVMGLVRPFVYVPTDFFQKFSAEQQRWVIQHELTHAARKDLWMQLAWESLRGVFWFNPIVHLAAGALRHDQELACDQSVLGRSGSRERYEYGEALLIGARPRPSLPLPSFFGRQKERIAMIGNHRSSPRRDLVGAALCALVGLVALTKAPLSIAELVSDQPMNLHVRSMPVAMLVKLVVDGFGPGNVTGLEQLGDREVTLAVDGAPARDTLKHVLSCMGFTYTESTDALTIVPLPREAPASACSDIKIESARL